VCILITVVFCGKKFTLVGTLLIFIIDDQAAQSRYKKADELCQELGVEVQSHQASNQGLNKLSLSEIHANVASDSVNAGSSLQKGQSVMLYSDEGDGGEHNVKTTNLPTKLAAGLASDEIYIDSLSSRANGGNHVQQIEERTVGNKRQKLEEDTHISQPQSQPPPPLFPHPDTFQPPPPPEYPPSPEPSPPPQPTSLPPQLTAPAILTTMPPQLVPPLPPTAGTFIPFPAGPPGQMTGMPYGTFPSYTPMINFPMGNMPPGFPFSPNPPPAFQGFGGAFYGAPYSTTSPPVDKKQE
jgi:regulator of Ty1 transposition protein 103